MDLGENCAISWLIDQQKTLSNIHGSVSITRAVHITHIQYMCVCPAGLLMQMR